MIERKAYFWYRFRRYHILFTQDVDGIHAAINYKRRSAILQDGMIEKIVKLIRAEIDEPHFKKNIVSFSWHSDKTVAQKLAVLRSPEQHEIKFYPCPI